MLLLFIKQTLTHGEGKGAPASILEIKSQRLRMICWLIERGPLTPSGELVLGAADEVVGGVKGGSSNEVSLSQSLGMDKVSMMHSWASLT